MATAPVTLAGNPLPPLAPGEEPPLREPPPRSIRESLRLNFRGAAFNLLNSSQFGRPNNDSAALRGRDHHPRI